MLLSRTKTNHGLFRGATLFDALASPHDTPPRDIPTALTSRHPGLHTGARQLSRLLSLPSEVHSVIRTRRDPSIRDSLGDGGITYLLFFISLIVLYHMGTQMSRDFGEFSFGLAPHCVGALAPHCVGALARHLRWGFGSPPAVGLWLATCGGALARGRLPTANHYPRWENNATLWGWGPTWVSKTVGRADFPNQIKKFIESS